MRVCVCVHIWRCPKKMGGTQVIIQVIRLIRRIFRKTIRVHRWKILRDFEGSIVMGIHKIAGWFILENPTKMDDLRDNNGTIVE